MIIAELKPFTTDKFSSVYPHVSFYFCFVNIDNMRLILSLGSHNFNFTASLSVSIIKCYSLSY